METYTPVGLDNQRERIMNSTMPRLLDVQEAANILGCSQQLVRNLIREGRIAPTRVGRLVRISEESLSNYIHSITR